MASDITYLKFIMKGSVKNQTGNVEWDSLLLTRQYKKSMKWSGDSKEILISGNVVKYTATKLPLHCNLFQEKWKRLRIVV